MLCHREAIPLFRVWKSLQRFVWAEVSHEGSHRGEALPLHRVWKELQEVVPALYSSEGKVYSPDSTYHQGVKGERIA